MKVKRHKTKNPTLQIVIFIKKLVSSNENMASDNIFIITLNYQTTDILQYHHILYISQLI